VRNNTIGGTVDKVGVYAQFTYTDVTGIFPQTTRTITDYAVYAIQPDV
jgi:hypothetical protein